MISRRELEHIKNMLRVSKEDLKEVIAFFIAYANKYIDFARVKRMYGIEEERSALIKIVTEVGEEVVGVVITSDNKVLPYTGVEKATIEITLTENVFWAIVAGKLDIKKAWAAGLIDVNGENPIRDALIIIPLVDTLKRRILVGS